MSGTTSQQTEMLRFSAALARCSALGSCAVRGRDEDLYLNEESITMP